MNIILKIRYYQHDKCLKHFSESSWCSLNTLVFIIRKQNNCGSLLKQHKAERRFRHVETQTGTLLTVHSGNSLFVPFVLTSYTARLPFLHIAYLGECCVCICVIFWWPLLYECYSLSQRLVVEFAAVTLLSHALHQKAGLHQARNEYWFSLRC